MRPVGTGNICPESLAETIFLEMKRISPTALVQGNPATGADTLIDGTFDLKEVAVAVLRRLSVTQ